jgi:hypothetical protein
MDVAYQRWSAFQIIEHIICLAALAALVSTTIRHVLLSNNPGSDGKDEGSATKNQSDSWADPPPCFADV